MADDKTKRDFRDRNRVSADENYKVEYFALEMGITPDQVRDLIKTIGNDSGCPDRSCEGPKGAEVRYRTNNEATGYRGNDHDQPIKPEAQHFEHRPICEQDFDMRDLGQVLHHAEPEHQPLVFVN